jgi:hypothetical protein
VREREGEIEREIERERGSTVLEEMQTVRLNALEPTLR